MHSNHTLTQPYRVQGQRQVDWPDQWDGEPTTCVVALRVQQTQDREGQDVDILFDRPQVKVGAAESTLRELLIGRIHGTQMRQTVLDRLGQIGQIDESCPLVLEYLHEGPGGACVIIEALVLPINAEHAGDLQAIRDSESDARTREEFGWMFAEDLESIWREAAGGRLPIAYLDDEAAPSPMLPAAMLAASGEPNSMATALA